MAAKVCDVAVVEFDVGIGPRCFSVRLGETDYTLRAFPCFGYVKTVKEITETSRKWIMREYADRPSLLDESRWLSNKNGWVQAIVYCGGVLFNLMALFVALAIRAKLWGIESFVIPPIVKEVLSQEALAAGLKQGDVLEKLDGRDAARCLDWSTLAQNKATPDSIEVFVRREGVLLKLSLSGKHVWKKRHCLWETRRELLPANTSMLSGAFIQIKQTEALTLIENRSATSFQDNLAGPIGVIRTLACHPTTIEFLLLVVGMLSFGMALVNILPLPGLDGGGFFLSICKIFSGHELTQQVNLGWVLVGSVILFGSLFVSILRDIWKCFRDR